MSSQIKVKRIAGEIVTKKIQAIRSFAKAGFALFPLAGRTKIPPQGFTNWGATSPGKFGEKELAGSNYAWVIPPGIIILDIDPRNFPEGDDPPKRLIADLGGLPETFKVKTGGGGWHLAYRTPPDIEIVAKLRGYPGIDVKSHGGYVVCPGSEHPETGKPYEIVHGDPEHIAEAPQALLDRIKCVPVALGGPGTEAYHDDASTVARYRDYLLRAAPPAIQGENGNATAYAVACRGRDLALPSDNTWALMCSVWNRRCQPEWDADELKKIVFNAYRYAKNPIGVAHPCADFEVVPKDIDWGQEKTVETVLKCISGEELWKKAFPVAPCLVEEFLPEGSCSFLAGPSSVRKTWWELEIALAVVSGHPVLGRFKVLKPGPVLMVMGEDSLKTIRERMQMLARGKGLQAVDLKNLYLIEATGVLSSDTKSRALADLCRKYSPRLIVLDPFVRMHTCDENSAQEIQPILGYLRELQREFDVSVLVTHHLKKNRDGATGRMMELLRGSGDMGAWADTVFMLERFSEDKDSPTRVTIAKQRDMPERPPFMFTLEIENGAAHLVCQEGDVADFKIHDLSEKIRELLKTQPNGVLKSELLNQLSGNHALRRKALRQLEDVQNIEIRNERRRARDGKERITSVVYLAFPTLPQVPGHRLAQTDSKPTPTLAAPYRGAGVDGEEDISKGGPGQGLAQVNMNDPLWGPLSA